MSWVRAEAFRLVLQPFQWSYGQAHPTQNEFSWTNLSSILFLEQPVGTGFSQGKPNVTVRFRGYPRFGRELTSCAIERE